MTEKIEIIERLGERALLLPTLLAGALAANERLKLRLTLLQEAVNHARHPDQRPHSFASERHAAGLENAQYDMIVSGARLLSADRIAARGAKAVVEGIAPDLATMLAPLQDACAEAAKPLTARMATIAATVPAAEKDELAIRDVDAMTSARRDGPDSVHLLVLDAHAAINRLAVETAVETIDGAHVHHVDAEDRAHIKAFMAGLNRTAGLAFGHPGLGATAVRVGPRLTIQNDIGTTDAHVLVVHVEGSIVSITHTDVHRQRAKFFISLFENRAVEWSPLAESNARGLPKSDVFYLVVGRFTAEDEDMLDRFLDFVGSRIVFLIDWNKARKALQTFVGKNVATEILSWAAANDYGHRAFLELGGANLVFEAIRRTASGRMPYGARLDETLGTDESADFLRRVLRQSCEGLRAGRSARLIRDEIQADLSQLLESAESALLAVLVRHLGLTRMLAGAVAEAFADGGPTPELDLPALVRNARRLEGKADRLTVSAREICGRVQRPNNLRQLVDEVENATDALDECAFLLSLLPATVRVANVGPLTQLCDIVIDSIGHLVSAIEASAHVREGYRADAADSLQSIDSVLEAERRADGAERDALSALMRAPCADARTLMLGLEVARALETATDHLAHAALSLRDRILEELSA